MKKESDPMFEQLKEAFRQYRKERTVKEWNELREEAKEHYDEKYINMLDASGYITKWMKGE
jgi:midasin (ATPase involved in ribosome maturation)